MAPFKKKEEKHTPAPLPFRPGEFSEEQQRRRERVSEVIGKVAGEGSPRRRASREEDSLASEEIAQAAQEIAQAKQEIAEAAEEIAKAKREIAEEKAKMLQESQSDLAEEDEEAHTAIPKTAGEDDSEPSKTPQEELPGSRKPLRIKKESQEDLPKPIKPQRKKEAPKAEETLPKKGVRASSEEKSAERKIEESPSLEEGGEGAEVKKKISPKKKKGTEGGATEVSSEKKPTKKEISSEKKEKTSKDLPQPIKPLRKEASSRGLNFEEILTIDEDGGKIIPPPPEISGQEDLPPVKPLRPQKKTPAEQTVEKSPAEQQVQKSDQPAQKSEVSAEDKLAQKGSALLEPDPAKKKPASEEKKPRVLAQKAKKPAVIEEKKSLWAKIISIFRSQKPSPLAKEPSALKEGPPTEEPPATPFQEPSAEKVQPKKVAISKQMGVSPEDAERLEQERLKREQARKKRSPKKRRKMKRREKKKTQESIRERSRERRKEKRKSQEERARQRSKAISLAASEDRHWSTGIPLLEKIFTPSKGKDKKAKEASPDLREKIESWRRRRRASQAQKIWEDIVGLDIGASALRAAIIEDEQVSLVERKIPDGIIIKGVLAEPEELSSEIKALWREEGISSQKVNFSFQNNLAVVQTFELSADSEDDIRQAVALNSEPLVAPMSPEDVAIDYAELSRSGASVSLQVAAADEEMVTEFVEAVENAGLVAAGAELTPLALKRAVRVTRQPGKAQVLLDVGAETTSFLVAAGPDAFFWRVIEIGGNDFTKAIVQETHIPWGRAEQLKYELSSKGDAFSEEDLAALKAIQATADRLIQEVIQTEALYRDASSSNREITGYQLLGGGAKIYGLEDQLHFAVQREISSQPQSALSLVGDEVDLSVWGSALGLASDHQMSLIPQRGGRKSKGRATSKISAGETQARSKQLTASRSEALLSGKLLALLALCVGLLLPFGWAYSINNNITTLEEEVATLEALPRPKGVVAEPVDPDTLSPNWPAIRQVLDTLEKEEIEVLELNVADQNAEIFVSDYRSPNQVKSLFEPLEVEVESLGTGETAIRVGVGA